ncbi:MAG: hypothetical protein WC627_12250 [Legionella sp.]
MLSPQDELLLALAKENYELAMKVYIKYPEEDLISVTDEEGDSQLLNALSAKKPSLEFIGYLINHPNFDIGFSSGCGSNIKAIIRFGNHNILQMVIDNQKFIYDGKKLTYETAKTIYEASNMAYSSKLSENSNSEATIKFKERAENYKQIMNIIRDTTIRHAIKTDDPDLFDRLDKAGANPTFYLSDGTRPRTLLTENNPKLKAWFEAQIAMHTKDISDNPNSLYNRAKTVKECEAKLAQLEIDRTVAIAKIYAEAAESRLATFNTIASFTN